MKLCTKPEYLAACRAYPHEWAKYHEGTTVNAVEWIDDNGRLLASALYTAPIGAGRTVAVEYRIAD